MLVVSDVMTYSRFYASLFSLSRPQFHVNAIRIVDIHRGTATPCLRVPRKSQRLAWCRVRDEVIDRASIHDQAEMVHPYRLSLSAETKSGR